MTHAVRVLVVTMFVLGACGDESSSETIADGAFGATCTNGDECDSGTCFEYGSKGTLCTEECPEDPAECPNDGLGCNDKGVCKVE